MTAEATHIPIRELQRNAAAVLSRVERGESYLVTRHGRAIGRLLPPDAADESINAAIDAGVLDPDGLARARTARQTASVRPSAAPRAGGQTISGALEGLRAGEA